MLLAGMNIFSERACIRDQEENPNSRQGFLGGLSASLSCRFWVGQGARSLCFEIAWNDRASRSVDLAILHAPKERQRGQGSKKREAHILLCVPDVALHA